MNTGGLVLIVGSLLAAAGAFIWLAWKLGNGALGDKAKSKNQQPDHLTAAAQEDVEHIFNTEFRQELRNRGRLHFEKILGENAMFLQQDLRLTTAQLNDYMKDEITRQLKDAFTNYESAIGDAKQLAIDSIEKTKAAIDEQREVLGTQLEKEVA